MHPLLTFFMAEPDGDRVAGRLAGGPRDSVHLPEFRHLVPGTSIALFGERQEGYRALRDFGSRLALATGGAYALLVLTLLSDVWLGKVSGLSTDLAGFALLPAQLVLLMPSLEVLLSFQRALLVHARMTW